MTNEKEKTFIRITNKDIYNEIKDGKEYQVECQQKNNEKFNKIIRRLDITNGKVKNSKWVASTALAVAFLVLGYLFQHISKG